jgi:hypothetical protein
MKEVKSYQCEYCRKLYELKASCRSHEYQCYYNPRTRSCASCAFLRLEYQEYKPHHTVQFQTCLINEDISKFKLKTSCPNYLNNKYKEDRDIMNAVFEDYDLETPFNEIVEQLKLRDEKMKK